MRNSGNRVASTVVFLSAAILAASCGPAASADNAAMQRTIVVNGDGQVTAKPDQAQLSSGVVSQAATAAAALSANTTAMNKVFAALKAQGIPDNKIRTSNFSVNPQYPPYTPNNPQPQRIVGYQVSNQVTVVLDDIAKLGPALDALVTGGANQVNGISFSIANPKPLAEKARAAAVSDAVAKANTLASAAGVTLGPVISIQEGGISIPGPRYMAFEARAAAGPPPVAAGEENVSVNVTVTYAIQ